MAEELSETGATPTLDEERLEALLRLARMGEASADALCEAALADAVRLTGSRYGYLAFVNEDETSLHMHAWSGQALADCRVAEPTRVFAVEATGSWGEPVRLRRPVITNDYAAPHPAKHGTPAGHVPLTRHLGVPIEDGARVVLVVGVANKPEDYDGGDVRQLTLLMQGLWLQLRRRRELERLRQHEQAEVLARISSGVAHDLNNMVGAVRGCLELIGRHLGDNPKARQPHEVAVESCDQAIALLRQLLMLGRRAEFAPFEQSLNELVARSSVLARAMAGQVELELAPGAAEDRVCADAGQCELALLNLVANARDAMPQGGRIVVATGEQEIPDTGVEQLHGIRPGRYLAVSVRDTGPGIAPAIKPRLFQPFFTTKPPGKGTGLGLCAVREVMQQHGGMVTVESTLGAGATFTLLFPRVG